MRIVESKDAAEIRPLYDAWLSISKGVEFGLDIDVDFTDENLQKILVTGGSLLVAYDDEDKPVGFFAISPIQSFFGRQMIAMEAMWFCLPNAHRAGPALLKEARQWSKEHGCSHLMISGSRLASDMHDSVCHFCERVGGKHFETVYLMEVN